MTAAWIQASALELAGIASWAISLGAAASLWRSGAPGVHHFLTMLIVPFSACVQPEGSGKLLQAEALRRDVDDRAAQRKAAEEGLHAAQRALSDAQARLASAESSAAAQVSLAATQLPRIASTAYVILM